MLIPLEGAHANPAHLEFARETDEVLAATCLLDQHSAVRARLQEHDSYHVVPQVSPSFEHGNVLHKRPLVDNIVGTSQPTSVEFAKVCDYLKRTVFGRLQRIAPLVVTLWTLKVVGATDGAILFHLDET